MFLVEKTLKILSIMLFTAILSACGGEDINSGDTLLTCPVPMVPDSSGTSCVDPEPIQCEAPTVPDALNESCVVGADPTAPAPVVTPGDNQAILFYNRAAVGASNAPGDPSYEGYRLHTWNNASCDSYAEPFDASDWSNGHVHDGVDPTYGAYWILNLKEGYGECANFIIHIGTDDAGKALGPSDLRMPLNQEDPEFTRMNFTFHGVASVFEYPIPSLGVPPLQIADASAHWLDAKTFVWDIDPATIDSIKLHHSATAGIEADDEDNLNGSTLMLSATELTDEQKAMAPEVKDWPAFAGDWSDSDAKAVLKNQLVMAGYNADGQAIKATYVQTAKALDYLYTMGEADADEAMLGVQYSGDAISASVWAPTAQSVSLKVYDAAKSLVATHAMIEDSMTGIWSYSGDASLDRHFYRYELTVYHPQNKAIEVVESTDPYSVGLSTNGMYSQFVNLNDDDLKPAGWDGHDVPAAGSYESASIYEGHIRDFSIMDSTVSAANRGKYMAFTETDSNGMQHLSKLAEAGMKYFHLLPANDIASINEDESMVVNLDDTVADLCAMNANAPVCGVESGSATLKSVMESYSPYSNDAANLMNALRGYDSFNWGYDPKHFNVPDGSYASDSDGTARILEMRSMVKALHDTGLRVALDVVYNHTNSAGLWDNSVFDKVVPGYYQSLDPVTGSVRQSTCCNDTALEHKMMGKFMKESLQLWSAQYGIDAFRFDIMSHGSKQQMLDALAAVQQVDEDVHFYGEGWNRDDRGFEQANQFNMAGTEIGTFNDRLRDAVRSFQINSDKESEDGPYIQQDLIKLGMAGSLADYVLENYKGTAVAGSSFSPAMYAKDPADVINYVSKHDNESLWDMMNLSVPYDMMLDERVRAQNMAQSIVLLSQGIPFLQMGGDMLRSKSLDGNTYDAGDWFNAVDFSMESNNWNVGLPMEKRGRSDDTLVSIASNPYTAAGSTEIMFASNVFNEFLSIRSGSPLFSLATAQDIIDRVGFHNIGKRQQLGLIVMSIDDGTGLEDLDPMYDAIAVVINGTDEEQSHSVNTAEGFELHPTLMASVDGTLQGASFSDGTFTVPAMTTAVFVKKQGETQGMGLSATATAGAPDVVPYGDTTILARGGFNGWSEDNPFTYVGQGVYQQAITLEAGEYEFKVASADWATVNLGAPAERDVLLGEDKVLVAGSNDNLKITITETNTYLFKVDASDTSNPVLTVNFEEPFYPTTVYLRGGMNGWGEVDAFEYTSGGIYTKSITMAAGSYEFKVASGDWSTVNMGAPADDKEVLFGEEQLLVQGSNDNMMINVPADGEYMFIFNASNLAEPTLTVYSAQMFGDTTVFIRGGMNGWGEVDALSYAGDGVYTAQIAMDAGDYEFKVASGDWATFNLGANEAGNSVELGSAYTLVQGSNGNLSISIAESGTYTFSVKGPNPDAAKVTVTKN